MASRSTLTMAMMEREPGRPWRRLCLCTAVLLGCGPILSVEVDEQAAGSTSGEETSLSVTGMPDDPACIPGEQVACVCSGAAPGTAICGVAGVFGPCGCDDAKPTGEGTSAGATGSEESGWAGSSSSGGGSTSPTTSGGAPAGCLPLDQPCPGDVSVQTDAEVEAIAACSRIEGSLQIRFAVTDLSPLTCLREVGNELNLESVDIPSLAALSNLQHVEGGFEAIFTRMTSLSLPSLEYVGYFGLYQNNEMLSLDVPSLTTISEGLDVHDNVLLSTCEVASLADEAVLPGAQVFYDGNADDCPSSE
ncbi:MAG: hypothetical protein ACRBN8_23260 [Nannocystales bacterium]